MHLFLDLLALVRALAADRARLALESVVLRQQINVLRRSVKRARLNDGDRLFWVLLRRLVKEWKEHLVLVKPETVVRRHRQGFRYYWRWKSRATGGRPAVGPEVIALGEGHLRRVLREYAEYYNRSRFHLSLDRNAPEPRAVEAGRGPVLAVAHLGGRHHRYTRAA